MNWYLTWTGLGVNLAWASDVVQPVCDLICQAQAALRGHGVMGALLALAVPFLSKRVRSWFKDKGALLFCSWWVSKVKAVIAKDHGPIWDWYIDKQIALHAEWAQRLFPGEGMGPQRKEWLLKHVPALAGFEAELDAFVKANKSGLQEISRNVSPS